MFVKNGDVSFFEFTRTKRFLGRELSESQIVMLKTVMCFGKLVSAILGKFEHEILVC